MVKDSCMPDPTVRIERIEGNSATILVTWGSGASRLVVNLAEPLLPFVARSELVRRGLHEMMDALDRWSASGETFDKPEAG